MAIRSKPPISNQLRRRIFGLFLVLSSLVYILLTLVSIFLFHAMMMHAVDNNLRMFSSTVGRAITVEAGRPHFKDWLRTVETEPNRSIVTMQLYDANKELIDSYGPERYKHLALGRDFVRFNGSTIRVRASEIIFDKKLVGYVQTEIATDGVEEATQHFGLTMALIALIVIAGLAATSFVVSGQVANPFVENVITLRRFIGDAGHELKSPLSIVTARAESLAAKLERQGLPTKELDIIRSSLERMDKIVSDLMLLTEVEGRLVRRQPEVSVDLDKLTSGLVEEFKEKYSQKKVNLNYESAPASVPGYPDALQRLISNLLDNALKYTEEGGKVAVKLRSASGQVQLIVQDTGIGIPADSLPHVFDRFYRVDKSRSRASGGAGLGLSIVKAIAEAHNGSVSVESEMGTGTRFCVTLPAAT